MKLSKSTLFEEFKTNVIVLSLELKRLIKNRSVKAQIIIHQIEETYDRLKNINHEQYDQIVFWVDSVDKLRNISFIDNQDL